MTMERVAQLLREAERSWSSIGSTQQEYKHHKEAEASFARAKEYAEAAKEIEKLTISFEL